MDELLRKIASNLGTSVESLSQLIKFESNWNPRVKNPYTSARGLIQFTDLTAKSLGYNTSFDLIANNPTIEKQLPLVYEYLKKYAPLNTLHRLAMAVFYPAYINKSPYTLFPKNVTAVNPGIYRPVDYVNLAFKKKLSLIYPVIILGSVAMFYMLNRKKRSSTNGRKNSI